MDIRQLSPRFFVSPQISSAEVSALKDAGITCILCNRPDSEVPPSHQSQAIRAAAKNAGLRFVDHPLTHQSMVPDVIANIRADSADTDDVVLAYCASGTRSCIAWALGQAGKMDVDSIITAAADGGYDISYLRATLSQTFE